jgi:homoserine kinase
VSLRVPGPVTVDVPASSANLGPGYDCLALALEMRLRVSVLALDDGPSELRVTGEGAGVIALDGSNRFLTALERGLANAGTAVPAGWRIEMANEIPLRRGLGSSAAATVAGILAAEGYAGADFGPAGRLALATELEGHADNAAAALLGGFVVVAGGRAVRFDPPPELRLVLFVPQAELATADMRAVLPQTVAHGDAAHNVAQAAMVVAAMATGDLPLLAATFEDRLHEPHRSHLFRPLRPFVRHAREAGAVGAALSGAGSSIIAFCDSDAAAAAVATAWRSAASRLDVAGEAIEVRPAVSGAFRGRRSVA